MEREGEQGRQCPPLCQIYIAMFISLTVFKSTVLCVKYIRMLCNHCPYLYKTFFIIVSGNSASVNADPHPHPQTPPPTILLSVSMN